MPFEKRLSFPSTAADNNLLLGKLNFQKAGVSPWSLGKYATVFLHPTLESLTLVAAEINPMSVGYLRHYRKLTPLSHLHLDHCDVSFRALEAILSLPRALELLELQEYDYGRSYKYGLTSPEELKAALVTQKDTLRELHLGLRRQSTIFAGPLDSSYMAALQCLTIECAKLDNITHAMVVPNGENEKDIMLIASNVEMANSALVWMVVPQFSMRIVLQSPPGYMPSRHTQLMIEGLGQILRGYNDRRVKVQLLMVRLTELEGAVPPYLHDEKVPEKVLCYDSFTGTSTWHTRTDAEMRAAEEICRMRHATAFSSSTVDTTGDFLLGQLNSA